MNPKHELRRRRHYRLRRKVVGTPGRPRLAVFRSLNHIYAQVIDDTAGHTVAAASTLDPPIRSEGKSGGNVHAAAAVGRLIAERARESGVQRVVFDRGGFKYHGRVRQLAEAAREGGLEF
jgi:large subunit ribosomal protein L18